MALEPYLEAGRVEAGVDEAGRGALAGPVVAAAVILPPDFRHPTLTDSKQLGKPQREALREVILAEAVAWGVGIVSVARIDEINILQAAFEAMHEAIGCLTVQPDHLVIDGNRFRPHATLPHTCVIKGDGKLLHIAAASILAKTYRDDLMHLLHADFPAYRWAENAGYPTPNHRRMIQELGPTHWHRRSFTVKPVQAKLF